jgi:hypothetical protein
MKAGMKAGMNATGLTAPLTGLLKPGARSTNRALGRMRSVSAPGPQPNAPKEYELHTRALFQQRNKLVQYGATREAAEAQLEEYELYTRALVQQRNKLVQSGATLEAAEAHLEAADFITSFAVARVLDKFDELKALVQGNDAELKALVKGNDAELKALVKGDYAEVQGNDAELKALVQGNDAELKALVKGNYAELKALDTKITWLMILYASLLDLDKLSTSTVIGSMITKVFR